MLGIGRTMGTCGLERRFTRGMPTSGRRSACGLRLRLVRQDPPAPEDFKSLAVEQPDKEWDTPELDCQSRGLSVFRDPADAIKMSKKVPSLRDRLLAQANLDGANGVLKHTSRKSSHHTWWLPSTSSPENLFVVLDSEG